MAQDITAQQFEERFGVAPEQDDLERANCPEAGLAGHKQCGVCEKHQKPRFICGCYTHVVKFYESRRVAIGSANRMTRETEEQHHATHVKGKGWLIKNAVRDSLIDANGTPVTVEPETQVTGEYYVELDADTELYCVFNEKTGDFAFSSWASEEDAQEDANARNKK